MKEAQKYLFLSIIFKIKNFITQNKFDHLEIEYFINHIINVFVSDN